MDFCRRNRFPLILGCDANAHGMGQYCSLYDTRWVATIQAISLWLDCRKTAFTADSIKWAIASFAKFTSPSRHGIFLSLLQQEEQALLPRLVRLMGDRLALAYIAQPRRTAKVIFIPKVVRKCYSLAKSFRPISLTSFLLKEYWKDHRPLNTIEGAEGFKASC